MWLKQITPPSGQPVSLSEAREHLRLLGQEHDLRITGLIETAADWVSGRYGITNRALLTQTWEWRIDAFPCRHYFELPLPPLQSVTWLKYLDAAGTEQIMSSNDYEVDDGLLVGRVYLKPGKSWPATQNVFNAVRVRFVCGYGDASAVPRGIKHAMLMLIAHWFVNPEALGGEGARNGGVQFAVEALLANHRIPAF